MMITILWDVTSCSVVEINRLLRETYNLFFHGTVEDGSKNMTEDVNVNRRPENSFQLVKGLIFSGSKPLFTHML
jgi:hypothetical protein